MSFLKEKALEWISDLAKSFFEKKITKKQTDGVQKEKLTMAFIRGANQSIRTQTNKDGIALLQAFVNNEFVLMQIEKMLDLSTKTEAENALINAFIAHSRGSFNSDFSYKNCIDSGLFEVRKEFDVSSRNIFYVSNQLETVMSQTQDSDTSTRQVSYTFESSLPLQKNVFFDYDHLIDVLNTAFRSSKHVAVSGIPGLGKKSLAAKYAREHLPCIWILASRIDTLDSLISAIENKASSIPKNHSGLELKNYFFRHPEWTIIFVNLSGSISEEALAFIESLSCSVLITTSAPVLGNIEVVEHHLPSEENAIKLYRSFLDTDDEDEESIYQIVRFASCIPSVINMIAQLQNMIRFSSRDLYNKLKDGNKQLLSVIPVKLHIDGGIIEQSIVSQFREILLPSMNLAQEEKTLISILILLPQIEISYRFISFIQDYFAMPATTVLNLVRKSCVKEYKNGLHTQFSLIPLLRYTFSESATDTIQEAFIKCSIEYIDSFCYIDYPDYIEEMQEACNVIEHVFNDLFDETYAADLAFLLVKKFGLLILKHDYLSCINECKRVLNLPGIEKKPYLVKFTKINLAKALALYELPSESERVLSELPIIDLTDADREQINEIRQILSILQGDYESIIKSTLLSIDTCDESRVGQYQLLATMYYYMQDIENAINYNKEAIKLLDKLHWTHTGIASMVYTSYSAALLQSGQTSGAIEYGQKGLAIALQNFGSDNSHTITSRNNLANAYFVNRQYQDAYSEYSEILDSYSNVYSSMAKTIINAKISRMLCELNMGHNYDESCIRRYALETAENPYNYNLIVGIIITSCFHALEDYRIDTLKRLLGFARIWIHGSIRYPSRADAQRAFMRLEMICTIGDKVFQVNPQNQSQPTIASKNFDVLTQMIMDGLFDNSKDLIVDSDEDTEQYIPIYCNAPHAPIMRKAGEPIFYLNRDCNTPVWASFGIRIDDDSMMPQISVNDILWICEQKHVPANCIAVFSNKDKTKWICRKVVEFSGELLLCPLNKKYPSFVLSNQSDWIPRGIVINSKDA